MFNSPKKQITNLNRFKACLNQCLIKQQVNTGCPCIGPEECRFLNVLPRYQLTETALILFGDRLREYE